MPKSIGQAYDMKVACFQEADPSPNVIQKRRLDQVSRRSGATQNVETPQEVHKITEAVEDVPKTKIVKGFSPIEEAKTSKTKLVIKVEGQDVHVMSTVVLLARDGRKFFLPQERKTMRETQNHLEIQNSE